MNRLHPVVNFIYFAVVLGCSMMLMHPVCLAISFVAAFCYTIQMFGYRNARKGLSGMAGVMMVAAILNPAFSHQGITILAYLPSGNPLTLESLMYGIAAAFTLVTVICWFSCFNAVMTSDKMVYLFGKAAPVLSMILSMTLRFIPDITAQFKKVYNAQKAMGYTVNGKYFVRIRTGCHVLSAVVTWALEKALITADSMRSRGYGLPGRTAYSLFRFRKSDIRAMLYILVCGGYVLAGKIGGYIDFSYYPRIKGNVAGYMTVSVYIVYVLVLCLPI